MSETVPAGYRVGDLVRVIARLSKHPHEFDIGEVRTIKEILDDGSGVDLGDWSCRFDEIAPALPTAEADDLRAALERIKFRLHFMGWPAENFWNAGTDEEPRWVPDWRYEIALIEKALHGSPVNAVEKPNDTRTAIEIAALATTPETAKPDMSAAVRLADTRLSWDYGSKTFFAVATLPNGERLPVESLREQSRIETTFRAALASMPHTSAADGLRVALIGACVMLDKMIESFDYLGTGSNSNEAEKERQDDVAKVQGFRAALHPAPATASSGGMPERYLTDLSAALGGISRYLNEQGDRRSLDDWSAFLLQKVNDLRLENYENRRKAEALSKQVADLNKEWEEAEKQATYWRKLDLIHLTGLNAAKVKVADLTKERDALHEKVHEAAKNWQAKALRCEVAEAALAEQSRRADEATNGGSS